MGVVRNICLSRLRSFRETLPIDEAAGIGDSDDAYAETDADNYLDVLMSRLPPAQRTVMMMRTSLQLETSAIAKATGFSEANVRQLLSRARRSMRNLYENKQI